MSMKFRGGDVIRVYLQGRQRAKLYCYHPNNSHLVELGEQELSDVRRTLRKLVDKHGKKIIKQFAGDQQGKCPFVWEWELQKGVCGVPDAGNEWALERDGKLVGKLGS